MKSWNGMGLKTLIIILLLSITAGYAAAFVFNRKIKNIVSTPKIPLVLHDSSPLKKEFFEQLFEHAKKHPEVRNGDIQGMIVNHHLLAAQFIAEAMNLIATTKPITIVLVSPNHFSRGQGSITSTKSSWATPYGVIEPNIDLIEKLTALGAMTLDDYPFGKEHGIFNITGFIKRALPNANIIPIIFRDTASDKDVDFLASELAQLPGRIVLIGSLDFSHYLPSNVADFHDAKSLAVIDSFDYEGLRSVEIDSKPTLRLLLKYLEARSAARFHLLENSNSAKLVGDDTLQETTSYVTGYFTNGQKTSNKTVNLLTFGDIMLDRYIRVTINNKGLNYIFDPIKRFLDGNDIVLANLEGTFTDFKSAPPRPNNLEFTFDPQSIPGLHKLGFNLLSLANNHSGNFGLTGLNQTRNYLEKFSIDFFGDPNNTTKTSVIREIRGTKIAFIGFNQFGQNQNNILEEIKKNRPKADFVIVMPHWGIEYQDSFSAKQQELAHEFINAGADIVIGNHPHVIEPIEIYKNGVVFYSLGNFIFDQLSSDKTKQGLAVGIELSRDGFSFYLFPFTMQNGQIHLLDKAQSNTILYRLSTGALTIPDIKAQIQKGFFSINKTN